jgi:hypothetical protein
MAKLRKFVYDSDGVGFTIYETIKSTPAGPTRYWLLEDYSTGKRRLLSNKTKKAACGVMGRGMVKRRSHHQAARAVRWATCW